MDYARLFVGIMVGIVAPLGLLCLPYAAGMWMADRARKRQDRHR